MEKYKIHTVTFHPFNFDIVSGMLWSLPIEGITEEENYLLMYSRESSGILKTGVTLILESLKEQNLIERYEVAEGIEEQQNWNAYWESKLNIIHVTDRLTIKPTFKEYIAKEDEIVIVIDPKMSFGTGEHETTKLCLMAMDKHLKKGDKVLDLGSGTGILAIASALLGAQKVYAADNDEWCHLNGRENIALNSVEDKVEIILGEIGNVNDSEFDLVIANINKNVLMSLGKSLNAVIKRAGKLILSGFYTFDVLELTQYYDQFDFLKTEDLQLNNWSSLVFEKKN
jgi:ribosomal protein L11 methyltransferase